MVTDIDLLRRSLLADSALNGFLDYSLRVKLRGSQMHSVDHCVSSGTLPQVTIALKDVFQLDHSHDCMKRINYFSSGSPSLTASKLIDLFRELSNLPHLKDLKNSEPTLEIFTTFFKVFQAGFLIELKSDGAEVTTSSRALLEWLHTKRGYPLDAQKVVDIFLSELEKVHEYYLLQWMVMAQFSERSKLDADTERFLLASKEKYDEEYAASRRFMCALIPVKPHQNALRGLKNALLLIALNKHAVPGTSLALLPPHLYQTIRSTGLIVKDADALVAVNQTPEIEELLTIDLLHNNGMTLKDASKSAKQLK